MDKWNDTKEQLDQIPQAIEIYIERKMRDDPQSVTVKDIPFKGKFFERAMIINGYECFVRLHKGKKSIGEIMAFNKEANCAYYRRLEDML